MLPGVSRPSMIEALERPPQKAWPKRTDEKRRFKVSIARVSPQAGMNQDGSWEGCGKVEVRQGLSASWLVGATNWLAHSRALKSTLRPQTAHGQGKPWELTRAKMMVTRIISRCRCGRPDGAQNRPGG